MKKWPKQSFSGRKSNELDNSEISLFIEENRNVLKYNRKDKN